jgi:hypothetical protein
LRPLESRQIVRIRHSTGFDPVGHTLSPLGAQTPFLNTSKSKAFARAAWVQRTLARTVQVGWRKTLALLHAELQKAA